MEKPFVFDVQVARAYAAERRATLSARRELAKLLGETDQFEPGSAIQLALGNSDLSLKVSKRLASGSGNEAIDRGDVAHHECAGCPRKLRGLFGLVHRILRSVVGTTDGRGGPARGEAPSRRCPPKGGA